MSEAVLQQYEHDMVHEHNEAGWEWGSKRQQWGTDLCSIDIESVYYKQTHTHVHILCYAMV